MAQRYRSLMQDFLHAALRDFPGAWRLVSDHALPRLRVTVECVVATDRAVLVFAGNRAAAEAAAVDLADFHAGCRDMPVLPVALLSGERVVAQHPLPFPGAAPLIACTRLLLPGLLRHVAAFPVVPGADPARWSEGAYRPVPGLMRAACDLYAGHGDAALRRAGSADEDLAATRTAIAGLMRRAQESDRKQIVFVTGDPGAGKTLCGLDTAFDPTVPASFLTGNPALLHVLRAALVRDAEARGISRVAAAHRVAAVVQPLHGFRDHYAAAGTPPDAVLVIDEAQRCWSAEYAIRKTLNKTVKLSRSEPGHILEIMGRRDGFCLILCLLGGGQEIHAGEGGIAEWGRALLAQPDWLVAAPPCALAAPDPRQCLPPLPSLSVEPALHLGQPIRSLKAPQLAAWVDAMLANDAMLARELAGAGLPVFVTRCLTAARHALRHPRWRAGLVASSGARRLRAEGLGGLLWHQDEDAVARWFLDRWPDIRSSDALEVAATEFGVQGLELDQAGLCWDLDYLRMDGTWVARSFRGTAWSRGLSGEALSNRRNTYRVLLTRARRQTVIWVPRGDPRDATRPPAAYDAITAFLQDCGVRALDASAAESQHAPMPDPMLL